MKRRQYLLMVVISIVAGLIGGAVSNRMLVSRIAMAQEKQETNEITADSVYAKEFRLVNDSGATLVLLSPVGGSPSLLFADDNGVPRISIGLLPDGSPGVCLHDSDRVGRILMVVLPDGSPGISLRDSNEKQRIAIGLLPDGRPSVDLSDINEAIRARLGCSDIETAKTGSVTQRPESSLVLFDKEPLM